MAMYLATDSEITSIADAIRTKGGTSAALVFPSDFVSAIQNIPTGITPTGTSVITANGVYDVTSFASASVSVPTGVTPTGTYSVSENGIYDITNYASVDVNVSGGGGEDLLAERIDATLQSYYNATVSKTVTYAFAYCSAMSTVELPALSSIAQACFMGCSSLTTASFQTAKYIGSSAFSNCKKLLDVYAPSVSTVDSSAFINCTSLVSVYIPLCKSIKSCAFQSCSSLTEITLPNLIGMAQSAFKNCSKFESLYLTGSTVATTVSNAFAGTPMSNSALIGRWGSIFVPQSLVSTYKSAAQWSVYSDRITAYVE